LHIRKWQKEKYIQADACVFDEKLLDVFWESSERIDKKANP